MKKPIRLIWQLYPTYLLITLLALGAASWYASSFLSDYFLERTIAGLQTHGLIITGQIKPHLIPLNEKKVDRVCKEIGKSARIRVTAILPDGRVIGDSDENPAIMDNHADRPEFLKAVSESAGSALRHSRTLDKRMMYVALPVRSPDRLEAILRTSIPLTDVDEELKWIVKNKEKCVAIGEVGLDYKFGKGKEKQQKKVFQKVIEAVEKIKKPIIVHSRKAEFDIIDMLESSKIKNIVLHCFCGRKHLVKRAADNGCNFSIPPIVVKLQQFQLMAELVNINQLLTETDAPYLSPYPGQRNEPAFVIETIKKINPDIRVPPSSNISIVPIKKGPY